MNGRGLQHVVEKDIVPLASAGSLHCCRVTVALPVNAATVADRLVVRGLRIGGRVSRRGVGKGVAAGVGVFTVGSVQVWSHWTLCPQRSVDPDFEGRRHGEKTFAMRPA